MCKIRSLVLLLLIYSAAVASAQRSTNKTSPWQTLSGNAPLVIARGGFSGLFPDSSIPAYLFASMTSLPNVILWCDLQLTKDDVGICFPDLKLDNASNIGVVSGKKASTYFVNGVPTTGFFSVDFTHKDLETVSLTQGIYSRSNRFDLNQLQILTVQDMVQNLQSPPVLWLNVQHDAFFNQHNLSMRNFVLSITRSVIINYISSPEVNFLTSILTRKPNKTKLVFRFLGSDEIEPSTNLTYGSLLGNLTFVKTFASGILVPKNYVWPELDLYLQPHTSIVLDAHKAGLEVFASDFSNDVSFAYDYSYDPVAEYVSFIDNGNFSVDGVLSDFPITPSNAIDCFSHIGKNGSGQATPLVISYKGASGDYPDCTDLAYKKAISDGVDVLDCPVQMTQDGIPVCLGSIDLLESTNVAQSPYSNSGMNIPELKSTIGIFTFNLTWTQIQNLKPSISNPYGPTSKLYRNPKYATAGNFMTLLEFLASTKNTSVSGVLISIENAAYLAEKPGLAVTDAVLAALTDSGYNNQTAKKVMIKSTDSSVLIKFKQMSNYELVYHVDETIRDALNSTILDIKKFAHSVILSKPSVFPDHSAFLTGSTDVVAKLKAFGLAVYVQIFSNEFLSQAWDFFSDPIVEINTYVMGAGIDGVISGFPGTAIKYRKNRCLALGDKIPIYMSPVAPGSLLGLIASPALLPPAEAPNPVLTEADVVEPPLPSAVNRRNQTTGNGGGPAAAPPSPPSGQHKVVSCVLLSSLAVLMATLLLF